jgi:hypothetical protein
MRRARESQNYCLTSGDASHNRRMPKAHGRPVTSQLVVVVEPDKIECEIGEALGCRLLSTLF